MYRDAYRGYIIGNLTCEAYNQEGFCSQYLQPLGADIIVNHSRVNDQGGYTQTANILYGALQQLTEAGVAHQKCLDVITPLLCRYIFVTCDPAYNTSVDYVYQPICRRGCDIVSLFVCPTVWQLFLTQLTNLEFGVLDPPLCDPLENANGGDAPDCIDTTDGGKSIEKYLNCQFCIGQSNNLLLSTVKCATRSQGSYA